MDFVKYNAPPLSPPISFDVNEELTISTLAFAINIAPPPPAKQVFLSNMELIILRLCFLTSVILTIAPPQLNALLDVKFEL